jgi:hypothetical protein
MKPNRTCSSFVNLALAAALTLAILGCTGPADPPPKHPVTVKAAALMPADGQVGAYTVFIDTGFLVFSDWAVFGVHIHGDVASILMEKPIVAHGGHNHGDAEYSAEVDGVFAVDLAGPPAELAVLQVTEGHYFDGRIRLVPAADSTLPELLPDRTRLTRDHRVWGHTLYLVGTANDGQSDIPFTIIVDAEATVAGLEPDVDIVDPAGHEIVLFVDLGAILSEVDFAALADPSGTVLVTPSDPDETYEAVKARLNDPATYLHEDVNQPAT